MKPTPESLARGKKQYGYDCTMCHGKDGSGNGDVTLSMKLKMRDHSDPATLKGPEGWRTVLHHPERQG